MSKLAEWKYKLFTGVRLTLPRDWNNLLIPEVHSPESARAGSLFPGVGEAVPGTQISVFDLICRVIEVQHSAQVSGVSISPLLGSVHSSLCQSFSI